MTQVQVNTALSRTGHFYRQMQNDDGGRPIPAGAGDKSVQPTAAGEPTTSLGHILRNNSLPDQIPWQDFAPSRNGEARRASAYPASSARRDSQFHSGPHLGQNNRFSGRQCDTQSATQWPWNSNGVKGSKNASEASCHDGLPGLGYSGESSPIEDAQQASRRGSSVFWNGSTSSSIPNTSQNNPTSRPPLRGNTLSTSSQARDQDRSHFANARMVSQVSKFLSPDTSSQELLPTLTPTSSEGTYSTGRHAQHRPSDLESSMQHLSFTNGYSSQKVPTRTQYDHGLDGNLQSRMSRNGSSPGQSSLSSDLGWKGQLPSRWAPGANTRGSTKGESGPIYTGRGFVRDSDPGLRNASEALQNPTAQMMNSRYSQYSAPNDGASPFRAGFDPHESAAHLHFFNGLPEDMPFDVNGLNYYAGVNNPRGYRQSPHPSRELVAQSRMLNLPPELASDAMHYFSTRNGQQWTNVPYSISPTPSMPYLPEPDPSKVWRSALLEEFRMSSRSGRRWELKDIYGHIVEFAGDQHGSRFLQDKLKTANSEEKERVFSEINPNAVQLMKDVFGNYVLQKFFEHGDQIQKAGLVNKMKGHVYALSTQTYACRVVQKALGHILVEQQVELMQELDGKVMDCIKCENGNHVVQVAIEQVPLERIPYMIEAIQHDVQYLSMHKYGCRVIQRMLEHARDEVLCWLVPELHKCCGLLIADQFGNYVPAHIVEKGKPEDRNRVIEVVQRNLVQFSKQKFASHVVEKCIRYGTDQQRRELMRQLCCPNARGENELEQLIRDGFANYVVQSLLETLQYEDHAFFCHMLQPPLERARVPGPNKQAENVARRMHRFERGPMLHHHHQQHQQQQQQRQPYMAGPTWNNSVFVESM